MSLPGAREAVIGRIRAALADGPAPAVIPRDYATASPAGTDIVEMFVGRVGDYRAAVNRTSAGALAATVAGVLAGHGADRLVVPVGIPDSWLAQATVERVADDPPLSFGALDELDGVITGCAAAIAETGTIILDAGPDQGRRALSLLPDLHVCVVRAEQIVGSVSEALARLEPSRPLTWISGPSATSDIELQRIEGVHGPRRLEVIVVEG